LLPTGKLQEKLSRATTKLWSFAVASLLTQYQAMSMMVVVVVV
jgi:hypothetical protein